MKKRAAGIEPASSAWKAEVLPLNYARSGLREQSNQMVGLDAHSYPFIMAFRLLTARDWNRR